MLDILVYRLFRTRRVILMGIVPTFATLALFAQQMGQSPSHLMLIAACLPALHAVIYPNNWTETLTVSLVTAACLALAATIPPDLAIGTLLMRYFWLLLLWFILFFVLVAPMSLLGVNGPISETPVAASATSRLGAEELKAALTYYPGRSDRRVNCGQPDADGRFPVVMRQEFATLTFEDEPSAEMREFGINADGVCESRGSAVIHSTGPTHHEIFYCDEGCDTVTACSYEFINLGEKGTKVVLREAGAQIPSGQRFGMWISDFLEDYLTDHIDAAEGRAPRANRAFRHDQLVVDLANVIVPILNWGCDDEPDNQKR